MAFICGGCGEIEKRWRNRCRQCSAWQTLLTIEQARQKGIAIPLDQVPGGDEYKTIRSGLKAFDEIASGKGGLAVGKTYLLSGDPGAGKCLGRGTPVMLASGAIVPVESITVGDALMGPDSKPRVVVSTTQGRGDLYEVRPVKGVPWVCNGDHILALTGTKKLRGRYREVAVRDILHDRAISDWWKLYRAPLKGAHHITNREPEIIDSFSIKPLGVGEFFGFELDGDGLFLLGDFTVTHNSTGSIAIAASVAGLRGKRVVYATTEEDEGEIKARAKRLGLDTSCVLSVRTMDVESLCAQVGKADLAVLDSLQGMRDRSGVDPDTIAKYITDNHAHPMGCTWILVGHIIKSGEVAGTEELQHWVDATLNLTCEAGSSLRVLRSSKNRCGPTDKRAFLRMGDRGFEDVPDVSSYLLADRSVGAPGSVVAATVSKGEQTAFLVEVQALVVPCFAEKEKPTVTCIGYSPMRLKQLRGILAAHGGLNLSDANVYVTVTGGVPTDDVGLDLPVALALASSTWKKAVPPKLCSWGELGLAGEVRSCREEPARERESKRAGYDLGPRPRRLSEALKAAGLTAPAAAATTP